MTGLYRFASGHRLDAPPGAVFEVLRDAESWPDWWRQIRRVTAYDNVTGQVEIRSLLPFTLTLEITSDVVDPGRGLLRARLEGDLRGWAEFVAAGAEGGTWLDYRQETTLVHPRLPGPLALAARPVLIANHAVMMRSGMRGLAAAARRRAITQ